MMKISINQSKTIGDIQSEFSKAFPFLKLEFFYAPHEICSGSHAHMVYSGKTAIGNIGCVSGNCELEITPKMTVEALEYALTTRFKVVAEVYRLSEGEWKDTDETDWWTLEEHNNRGEEAAYHSGAFHKEPTFAGHLY